MLFNMFKLHKFYVKDVHKGCNENIWCLEHHFVSYLKDNLCFLYLVVIDREIFLTYDDDAIISLILNNNEILILLASAVYRLFLSVFQI